MENGARAPFNPRLYPPRGKPRGLTLKTIILFSLSFQALAGQETTAMNQTDLVPGASITVNGNKISCTEGVKLKVTCTCVRGNFDNGDKVTFEIPSRQQFLMFHMGSAHCAQIRSEYVAWRCDLVP